ncbi:hypothetical protein D9M72_463780 [compost metagenome]
MLSQRLGELRLLGVQVDGHPVHVVVGLRLGCRVDGVLAGRADGSHRKTLVGICVVGVRLVSFLILVDVEALDSQPVRHCCIGLDQAGRLGVVRLEPVVDGTGDVAVLGLAAFGLDDAGDRNDVVLLRGIRDSLRFQLVGRGGHKVLEDLLRRRSQREPVLAGRQVTFKVLGLRRQPELGRGVAERFEFGNGDTRTLGYGLE